MTKAEKLAKLKKRQAEELAKTRKRADTIKVLEQEMDADRVKEIRRIYEAQSISFDALMNYIKADADRIVGYIKHQQTQDLKVASSTTARIPPQTPVQRNPVLQEHQQEEEEENPYA